MEEIIKVCDKCESRENLIKFDCGDFCYDCIKENEFFQYALKKIKEEIEYLEVKNN